MQGFSTFCPFYGFILKGQLRDDKEWDEREGGRHLAKRHRLGSNPGLLQRGQRFCMWVAHSINWLTGVPWLIHFNAWGMPPQNKLWTLFCRSSKPYWALHHPTWSYWAFSPFYHNVNGCSQTFCPLWPQPCGGRIGLRLLISQCVTLLNDE